MLALKNGCDRSAENYRRAYKSYGKKLFKEALRNNDMGYILNQAIEQTYAGADILT